MSKSAPLFLGLSLLLAVPLAQAADAQARWYRYLDDRHQPVVTDSVTPEHVKRGYDELSTSMQVIRHVDGRVALTAEQKAAQKTQNEAAAQRAQDDRMLMRLYSGPADAERMRNRQLDGIFNRIETASANQANLRQRRAAGAQKAATFERTGKPVPADIKDDIARLDKQLQASQAEIDAAKAEQAKVQADFDVTIKRLAELTGKPAGTQPWTPPAKPGGAPASTGAGPSGQH